MTVDRWTGGEDYEGFIGRWSRPIADQFLEWLAIPAGRRWVDVGCGTGALSGSVLGQSDPDAVIGVDPSPSFVAHALSKLLDPRVRFVVGIASELPIDDGWADTVVSGLVLNFIPDLGSALAEMVRVSTPGATIAAYVWDYGGGEMQLLRRFWDAAADVDPRAAGLDERVRFPLCAPEPLRDAFLGAGLEAVTLLPIDIPTRFRDFDDYWTPFLSGIGPAPGYVATMNEALRARLRDRLRATLPIEADGSIDLIARAWAVRGTTPRTKAEVGLQAMTIGRPSHRSTLPARRGSPRRPRLPLPRAPSCLRPSRP
ncbi:MAG: hypothetical protein QOJ75_2136 [Chloroflexota bacterium]|nr:hypothetical protein [Chloroflexota bacterium]